MTGAELKTLRERLGLSTKWVAALAGIANKRSVEYWESGRISPQRGAIRVPDDVATALLALDDQLWHAAEQAVEMVPEVEAEHGAPSEIVLYRYRTDAELWEARPDMAEQRLPVTCHAVLLSRTQWLLQKAGYAAVIEYADGASR